MIEICYRDGNLRGFDWIENSPWLRIEGELEETLVVVVVVLCVEEQRK